MDLEIAATLAGKRLDTRVLGVEARRMVLADGTEWSRVRCGLVDE